MPPGVTFVEDKVIVQNTPDVQRNTNLQARQGHVTGIDPRIGARRSQGPPPAPTRHRMDGRPIVGKPVSVSSEGLVGRDAEVALAATELRHLRGGRASVLVIEGEAGIGKTRLVEGIVEEARAQKMAAFVGQAHPFERTRPFGAIAAALDLTRRSGDPRRAALGALLGGGGGAGAVPGFAGDSQYRIIEDIVDLVESSCTQGPVLLVVEDIHWADQATLATILSLARHLTLEPLLVVVTARPSPRSADVARLLEDLAAGGARALDLLPLTPDDVALLARHVLGAAPGPELSALLAKAGGNPLWVTAMLRSLADEGLLRDTEDGIEATTSELPASLGDLVVRRLHHLPTETLELLRITAVLGDAVSLRDVAAVAHRPAVDVVGELGPAFDTQLLDKADERVVFRHQLVHDAIYQRIPPSVRRVLHREAAVALMAAGANRLEVADHLVRGADRGDEQAVAWLREAAGEASAQAPPVTAELMRRAEALLPVGHHEADPVASEVVQALLRAGQVAEASARAEAILARRHAPEVDIPLRLVLVGALALQNRADELIALAQASLDSVELGPSGEVMMLAQQSWALTYSGNPRGGESAAARGLAIAEGANDAAMTVWALTALMVAVGRRGRFGEALAHARRAAALASESQDMRSLPLQPKFFLGLALFDCDLVTEARAAFREALDDQFGSAWWLSETLMADAQASFVIGDWADAVPGLVAGGQAATEKGNPLLVNQSLAYRTIIATAMGDHLAATELAAPLVPVLEGDQLPYNAGILASALAELRVAERDHHGAYDMLLHCWRFDIARESHFYHRCLAPNLVRLALTLGHRDVAGDVAGVLATSAALAPDVPTLRSVALRCQGLVDGDVEELVEAVALARQSPHLVELTGACEDAAGLLTDHGRRDESAALLNEALLRYEHAGADAWAGRVRAQLRAMGIHPGPRGSRDRPTNGWESLTHTEKVVARLVAEGLTNIAVARQLYMSPHTVNTHLRHIFSKLRVPNRVALAALVHHSIE
ncbi:MAG TPA: AAA family ATPase [Nocardioides sp.]|uniref:ATP-binding protein n=1 Tax=Nocardioides sp. TaxID=35761 RepID=UPI002E34B60E|nr:AAA family ATPase [Nocardioides sp.]HEX5087815.1 AAA family ATPase [Nocardioides sp.]